MTDTLVNSICLLIVFAACLFNMYCVISICLQFEMFYNTCLDRVLVYLVIRILYIKVTF